MTGLPRAASVGVGLAAAAGVWMIYQNVLPPVVDVRVGEANDTDVSAAEKTARWTSGLLVGGVALLTQDMTVLIIGGVALICESWSHRHANAYDMSTQGIVVPPPRGLFASLKAGASVSAGV